MSTFKVYARRLDGKAGTMIWGLAADSHDLALAMVRSSDDIPSARLMAVQVAEPIAEPA